MADDPLSLYERGLDNGIKMGKDALARELYEAIRPELIKQRHDALTLIILPILEAHMLAKENDG